MLTRILGLSPEQADMASDAQREYEALSSLLLMRDAVFTLVALRQPDVPFAGLWRSVSRAWP